MTSRTWFRSTFNFSIDVYNPQEETLRLTIRIDDHKSNNYETRFNKRYSLIHGSNRIVIPLQAIKTNPKSRDLNLNKIERLLLFLSNPKTPFILYFDNIRLCN